MSFKISQRRVWDATATLEALGAAEVALWLWEPEADRLRVNGAARALGLGPLAPDLA
jgi:c-di-GMP-specific phosphodiesterase